MIPCYAIYARRSARSLPIALSLSVLSTIAAFADDSLNLPPMVVGATRLPTLEDQLGTSVSVISSEDIERKQQSTLADVLQDVPGLNLVQTGGPGGTTSVFMRGTNANHTKVFIDGVDVGDPSSSDGSFDFAHILTGGIDRIEVLRGPQSGLYGSDAIGGVINIITKTGDGPAHITGSLDGGSFGTFNQSVGLSGSEARFNYAFNAGHFRSESTPVTPLNLVPLGRTTNDNGYDNKTVAPKLGANLTDTFDIGVTTRYSDSRLSSTSDDSSGPETALSQNDNRQLFSRGTAHLALFDGIFDQTVGLAYTDYRRRYFDLNTSPATLNFYRGDRVKVDWQGNITVSKGEVLTLGAEHQHDEINDSSPVQAHVDNNAGFIQLQSTLNDQLSNAVNVRRDDNGQFGSKTTWREAPSYWIVDGLTKVKGSVGTGFKAPSLDQLYDNYPAYGFYANPNLKPETSIGYDFGFEQYLADKRVKLGSTYFHNNIKNLIADNSTYTSYINIGSAVTKGFENFVTYTPWKGLSLRGDYTYTLADDNILHQELSRRPKHKASLNAAWQATEALSLSATVIAVGSWIDSNRSGSASGLNADGYTTVNIAGSYDLGHGLAAFAKIDNLTDRHYQDPIGFLRPGIGVFGGLRVAFDDADITP